MCERCDCGRRLLSESTRDKGKCSKCIAYEIHGDPAKCNQCGNKIQGRASKKSGLCAFCRDYTYIKKDMDVEYLDRIRTDFEIELEKEDI